MYASILSRVTCTCREQEGARNIETELREAICEVGRRLHAKNLIAATDGNISIRLSEDRFLCTPSGVSKGNLQPDDLLVADAHGKKISGRGRVSTEIFTHLAAYEERNDISAVVHAHPPKAVALTLAGISMEEEVLPEVVYALGAIPTAPYATPGTPEGAEAIRDLIRRNDALLMDRHGALTVGPDVFAAYYTMEKLEHAAGIILDAMLLGGPRKLSDDELQRIYKARRAYDSASGNDD